MRESYHLAFKTLLLSAFSSAIIALVKSFFGYYGHSYALIADSLESVSDMVSSLLLAIALFYSSKKPNSEYPYGYGKIESLMSLLTISFIALCGWSVLQHGFWNLFQEREAPAFFTLPVLIAIVLYKEICFQYVYHNSQKVGSTVLAAEAWHHRADAITSLMALVGVCIALIGGEGYEHADDWAAIFAGLALFYNAYSLVLPAFQEILDSNVYGEVELRLRAIAQQTPGVIQTEKCYIRKSGMVYHAELHIQVDPDMNVAASHDLAHLVKKMALENIEELRTLVIHIEPFYPQ